ncbi:unnamed protein product [Rotaria socialis]|uniref:Apple domain-containing protein n=1 Tax=Rotaria socialis TaxID=392032 RepID=A0A818NTN5_9BILA|nr:unnamed protein product [Rotaria socialis]
MAKFIQIYRRLPRQLRLQRLLPQQQRPRQQQQQQRRQRQRRQVIVPFSLLFCAVKITNWDYPNNDLVNASPMTFSVCCAWCLATSSCRAFTLNFGSSTCWIKTSSGGVGRNEPSSIAAKY